jgi:glycosyltransferase involved in cell wall biosynthesis
LKTSIIIPSRNEEYLVQTVENILKRAEGEIEILVVLDGPPEDPGLPKDGRIKTIYRPEPLGMRNAINTAAKEATGDYLLKCDAHVCFDQGFDVKLAKDCEKDWTVVPRRYAIDKRTWDRLPNLDWYNDFQYISRPDDPKYSFKGVEWPEYGVRVKGKKICDLMTSQGSCWFMFRERFFELGGLDEENYGSMGAEAQEICLKSWLSGGKYMLNRNTWYCHKKKRESVAHRGYRKPVGQWRKSRAYAIDCWTNNKWKGQKRDFMWLIEKFKPVPGWHTRPKAVETERFLLERFKLNYGTEKYPRVIPGLNRDGLVKLWKDLGYKVGCEVGVEAGYFSGKMFAAIPGLKMYLVDPYSDYSGVKHRGTKHNKYEKLAHAALDKFKPVWMREQSETAFLKIPDKSLDFVYIDGNHKYDWVMLDILLWQRKVRTGGMVCGHDYETDKKPYVRDVRKAVDDYVEHHKICPVYLTDIGNQKHKSDRHASWMWVKG